VILAVIGYAAAFLTAFYAFRMVFRVFYRNPVPEARELEHGHLAHHEPENPATGEKEDTDVGFPGPEHVIAERSWPMKTAMAPLALLALIAGVLQVPGIDEAVDKFLEPSFADSRYENVDPSTGTEWFELAIGGLLAIAAISLAYFIYLRRRELRLEIRERFDAVHTFLFNRWYFDELYDVLFTRPVAAMGRFGRNVVETDFVQGTIVGGATGVVRVGSSFARAIQTGYLRGYALLLALGVAGLALYFLIASS
jgi:NADH-quinone oxidoreductase subunit L